MEPAAPGPLTGPPSWPSAPFGRQLPPPATACRPTEGDRWQRRHHQLPGRGGLFFTHVTGNLAILAAHLVTGSRTGVGLLLSVPAFVLVLASTRLLAAGLDATGVASPRPLLLAGLGGGMVTSPNVTLTLQSVPVRMAVAAGGAADRQRIGAAIGTALLVSVFYRVLTASGHAYATAVSDALLCACGLMLGALVLAIAELWQRRHHRRDQPRPDTRPQHSHLYLGGP